MLSWKFACSLFKTIEQTITFFSLEYFGWIHFQHTRIAVAFFIVFKPIKKQQNIPTCKCDIYMRMLQINPSFNCHHTVILNKGKLFSSSNIFLVFYKDLYVLWNWRKRTDYLIPKERMTRFILVGNLAFKVNPINNGPLAIVCHVINFL